MHLTKATKRYLTFGSFFAVLAILFTLLYYFNVIKTLDLYLAVTYVVYFAGLALIYNGAYNKEKANRVSKNFNYTLGLAFTLGATIMLIYGFATGMVSFFN